MIDDPSGGSHGDTTARPPESPSGSSRRARGLFAFTAALVASACVYYGIKAKLDEPLQLFEGLAILVLAAVPSLVWARHGARELPVFQVFMLTGANTFALPLLTGHEQLRFFSPDVVTRSGATVIAYQCAAIATFYLVRFRPGRSTFYTREVLNRGIDRVLAHGLTLTTIYLYLSTFTDVVPFNIMSVLRAVFYGVGLVSVFVQARQWGLGQSSTPERMLFLANLALQVAIHFSTLLMVGGVSLIALALVGFVSGRRQLPIVSVAALLLIVGLFHSGKSEMRDRYWDADGTHRHPGLTELPSFLSEWIVAGVAAARESDDRTIATRLLDRTSLFHLLCLVESVTPTSKPFLLGSTYKDIPAQFVPRFLWPEKPLGHVSTYRMSIYYGLQREEDTVRTTIGFGTVVEAFANFGLVGVAAIGCFFGALYKFIQARNANGPLLSYGGLLLVVLMAWSFQTESPLSMWLSSIFQAGVAVLGLAFVLRRILADSEPHAAVR